MTAGRCPDCGAIATRKMVGRKLQPAVIVHKEGCPWTDYHRQPTNRAITTGMQELVVGRKSYRVRTVHAVDVKINAWGHDLDDIVGLLKDQFSVDVTIIRERRYTSELTVKAENIPTLDRAVNHLYDAEVLI